jgi:GT2 family glycosyltransferase
LIELAGLMNERYFLYYEDLDWGVRAKRFGAVGYAHQSVVHHKGGSTIGTASRRAERSQLAVYLETRNRILFVKARYPRWLGWTIAVSLVRALAFVAVGAVNNAAVSLDGLWAGIGDEVGPPTKKLRGAR